MTSASRSPSRSSLFLAPLTILIVAACAAGGPADAPKPPAKVDYNRDVRPILSDNCFACHGPDAPHAQGETAIRRARVGPRGVGGR